MRTFLKVQIIVAALLTGIFGVAYCSKASAEVVIQQSLTSRDIIGAAKYVEDTRDERLVVAGVGAVFGAVAGTLAAPMSVVGLPMTVATAVSAAIVYGWAFYGVSSAVDEYTVTRQAELIYESSLEKKSRDFLDRAVEGLKSFGTTEDQTAE